MPLKLTKASTGQGKLKVCFYGSQGTGKTFTSLLLADYLAKKENKRIAYIDTERGTDFYSIDIPERKVHPKAFDFDRAVTRSITEVRDFVRDVDTKVYGVIVLDSLTHLWEAAKEAYTGPKTKIGSFPIQAWQFIKKPWRDMMKAGLDGQFHLILCGREGLIYERNEESGQDEVTGTKIKAEGEAGYEPHVLVNMFQQRDVKNDDWVIKMFVEKDRSGCLQGKTIAWPNGETFEPLYRYLTGAQGTFETSEDAAANDARRMQEEVEQKEAERQSTFDQIRKAIAEADDLVGLKTSWELTKGKKKILGDELFGTLEALKDARKLEINTPRNAGV